MTSYCLCLREERTVTLKREWNCKQDKICLILRIVNFIFYLMDSNNFLAQLKFFSTHTTKIFHTHSTKFFFLTQLNIFSYTT